MYSNDFIHIVLRLYNSRKTTNMSVNQILQFARISRSTLFGWIKKYSHESYSNYENGSNLQPPQREFNRKFFPKKINDNCLKYIIDYVLEKKVIDANSICKNVKNKFNIIMSKKYLYNLLKNNNISYKIAQKTSYPYDNIKFAHQKQQLKEQIEKVNDKLNYTDEMAIYLGIKPDYGWSEKGKRCIIKQPKSYANKTADRYSIVMTMTKEKIINYRLIRGTYNAKRFCSYIKNTIPKMGDTTPFMDGASIHKSRIVKKCLSEHGKETIINVPYSPQFNPIEYLFNPLKSGIKRKNVKSESSFRRFLHEFVKDVNKKGLQNYCKKSRDNLYD